METSLLIISGFAIFAALVIFTRLSGEKERIKTLFRVYMISKRDSPHLSEREHLEKVIAEHIPFNSTTPLRNLGVSEKEYLDNVFGQGSLTLEELIEHIIALEFPKKYRPFEIGSLDEMFERRKTGKLSPLDELKVTIKKYGSEFLGK